MRLTKLLCSLVVAGLACSAHPTAASEEVGEAGLEIDYRPPPEHLEITWDNGAMTSIDSAEGMVHTYSSRAGEAAEVAAVISEYALLQPIERVVERNGRRRTFGFEFDRSQLAAIWPLQAGNSVSYDVEMRLDGEVVQSGVVVVLVHEAERITVPAGEFDTVPLEVRIIVSGRSGQPLSHLKQLWYAPEVGYFVRIASRIERGGKRPIVRELQAKVIRQAPE